MTYIIEYAKYHRLKKWHAFHFFSLKTFVSQFAKLDFIFQTPQTYLGS